MLVPNGPEVYSSTDYLAFPIAKSYMNTVEGPLRAAVCGNGLAYHVYQHFANVCTNTYVKKI